MKTLKAIYSRQKSFYNKAYTFEKDGELFLQSYETIVAKIDRHQKLVKLWNGYSKTTLIHIFDFAQQNGIDFDGRKATWNKLEYQGNNNQRYKVVGYNGLGMRFETSQVFDDYDTAEKYAYDLTNGFWIYYVEEI